ncbi:hypothetical protein B0H14DRAFT_3480176 [Mycena olivaceomarginata]|nr:hypothetical protein B0H14DRAFT_3480176 [Mycena olivaceomarginata]
MDPIYFQDSLGNLLVPIWSKKDSVRLCSLLAPPTSVAPKIMEYSDRALHLLDATIPKTVLQDLDYAVRAVWYRSDQHWLGWIPKGEPRSSPYETDPPLDLLGICFERGPAPTIDEFYDVYDSDHQISPVERPAGCRLDSAWVQEVTYLGDRLHATSQTLAETSDFYSRGYPSNRIGDVPGPVDVKAIDVLFSNEGEAQDAAMGARRSLLSLLGFLSWMMSLVQLKDTKLSAGDQKYLQQLRLDERPKTGAVFNLTRDQHEINFPHWANNGVPFHYIWTEEEARTSRFLRFSPEYYEEVARLREVSGGDSISVEDLPSYDHWKGDLEGSDWIGQNLRAGKVGIVEHRFKPSMKYGVVDRHLCGARPLVNWITIRVYAERFKALIREGERETVCTFFRNNPINPDEPAYGRQPLRHRFALEDFAFEEVGESVPEQTRHYESNTLEGLARPAAGGVAEERPALKLRELPVRVHALEDPDVLLATSLHPVVVAGRLWRYKVTGHGVKERIETWFQEEFQSAANSPDGAVSEEDERDGGGGFGPKQDSTPFDASLDALNTWSPKYRTQKEAVDDLAAWAPSVLEYEPKKPAYDPLSWNSDWLDKAYLVVEDPRTLARLKTLCALFRARQPPSGAGDAGSFRNYQLSTLALNALPAVYNLGYVDQIMTWGGTSDAAQFGIYMGTIYQLLQKPNAIAFIAKGGICKFVAELFAPDLAYRFVRGPSEQVSEFGKGKTTRLIIDGESTLCINDQVTDLEVAILLGYVKGKNSDQERSLWPLQALLEQHSLHVRGYLSSGAYSVLEYLSNRILVEKIFDWRTKAEWKAYLRGGAKGEYGASVVPSKADFDEGWKILDNSFPLDWQHAAVSKIELPERFNAHAYRN